MRHAGLPSDETRSISTTHAMEAGSNYLTPPWFRVTAQSSTAFKVALADNDVVADTETAGTSPRSVSYKDLSAADSAVSWAPPLPPPPAGAIDAASFSSLSPPTLRLLPSLVPAGWALLIAIWAGLAVAIRAEASDAPPFLAIAFSGWTAVVATALGGLPLLLTRPERVPTKMIGVANAAAAGMMVGAGLGMFGGLVEELPATGSLAPAAGIAAGAVIVASVGGPSVNLMVTAALIVHNLPEGLAVAAPLALRADSRITPAAACLLASLTSLPQPLVGLGCCWLLQAEMHPLVPCLLTATSVGAVLWVAIADLFVESAASLGSLGALAVVAPTTALMLVHHALTD